MTLRLLIHDPHPTKKRRSISRKGQLTSDERAELASLRKENRELRRERIFQGWLQHTKASGPQYRATAYRQLLEDHQISCSMSGKGCCWDNAVVETFFSTIKHELGLGDVPKPCSAPIN